MNLKEQNNSSFFILKEINYVNNLICKMALFVWLAGYSTTKVGNLTKANLLQAYTLHVWIDHASNSSQPQV